MSVTSGQTTVIEQFCLLGRFLGDMNRRGSGNHKVVTRDMNFVMAASVWMRAHRTLSRRTGDKLSTLCRLFSRIFDIWCVSDVDVKTKSCLDFLCGAIECFAQLDGKWLRAQSEYRIIASVMGAAEVLAGSGDWIGQLKFFGAYIVAQILGSKLPEDKNYDRYLFSGVLRHRIRQLSLHLSPSNLGLFYSLLKCKNCTEPLIPAEIMKNFKEHAEILSAAPPVSYIARNFPERKINRYGDIITIPGSIKLSPPIPHTGLRRDWNSLSLESIKNNIIINNIRVADFDDLKSHEVPLLRTRQFPVKDEKFRSFCLWAAEKLHEIVPQKTFIAELKSARHVYQQSNHANFDIPRSGGGNHTSFIETLIPENKEVLHVELPVAEESKYAAGVTVMVNRSVDLDPGGATFGRGWPVETEPYITSRHNDCPFSLDFESDWTLHCMVHNPRVPLITVYTRVPYIRFTYNYFHRRFGQEMLKEAICQKIKAVLEPLKTRLISAGPPMTSLLCKRFQHALHATLRKSRQFRLIGEECSEQVLQEAFKDYSLKEVKGEYYWNSGDYKSATDYMHMPLSQFLMDEVLRIGYPELSRAEMISTRRLLGQSLLTYPSFNSKKGVFVDRKEEDCADEREIANHKPILDESGLYFAHAMQNNGQLMGSIVSFPFLCLANILVTWYSIERFHSMAFADLPILVNGDDILFRCTQAEYNKWCVDVRALAGFRESIGKNYMNNRFCMINSRFYDSTNNFKLVPWINAGLLMGKSKVQGKEGLTVKDNRCLDVVSTYLKDAPKEGLSVSRFIAWNVDFFRSFKRDGFSPSLALSQQFYGLGVGPIVGYHNSDKHRNTAVNFISHSVYETLPLSHGVGRVLPVTNREFYYKDSEKSYRLIPDQTDGRLSFDSIEEEIPVRDPGYSIPLIMNNIRPDKTEEDVESCLDKFRWPCPDMIGDSQISPDPIMVRINGSARPLHEIVEHLTPIQLRRYD